MKPLKIFSLLLIIFYTWSNNCSAQQDTLYFDPTTGNYIIQYLGTFIYIQGTDGYHCYRLSNKRSNRKSKTTFACYEPELH